MVVKSKMHNRKSKIGRRARHTTAAIDIHAHFVPEEYLRLIETEGEPHGVRLRRDSNGPMIMVGQATIGPITPHYHNLAVRLKSMNRQRVTVHALSLNPPMVYWANGALGIRL